MLRLGGRFSMGGKYIYIMMRLEERCVVVVVLLEVFSQNCVPPPLLSASQWRAAAVIKASSHHSAASFFSFFLFFLLPPGFSKCTLCVNKGSVLHFPHHRLWILWSVSRMQSSWIKQSCIFTLRSVTSGVLWRAWSVKCCMVWSLVWKQAHPSACLDQTSWFGEGLVFITPTERKSFEPLFERFRDSLP